MNYNQLFGPLGGCQKREMKFKKPHAISQGV